MTTIRLRVPEDVVDDLKRIAPELGFSGYPPLLRAYIGQGLRHDLERLEGQRRLGPINPGVSLLDTVALTEEIPGCDLAPGQVGTVVEILGDGKAFEVEFSDRQGRTYEALALHPEQFLVLRCGPAAKEATAPAASPTATKRGRAGKAPPPPFKDG